jgi:hypothetical protein
LHDQVDNSAILAERLFDKRARNVIIQATIANKEELKVIFLANLSKQFIFL